MLLTLALAAPATAVDTAPLAPDVRVNGALVTFPDTKPFVDENSRTLIPVRFVGEALGAEVSWENATQTAVIAKDGITVRCQIGNDELTVIKDGKTSTVKMDTKAVIKDGRTTVPIRYIVEALDGWIGYSEKYRTVQISSCEQLTADDIARLRNYYDMDDSEGAKAAGTYDGWAAAGWTMESLNDETDPFIFSNQNEKFYREPDFSNGDFFDYVTKETYSNGNYRDYNRGKAATHIVDKERYALGMLRNAGYAAKNPIELDGIKVDFKTDAALMSTYPSLCYHSGDNAIFFLLRLSCYNQN